MPKTLLFTPGARMRPFPNFSPKTEQSAVSELFPIHVVVMEDDPVLCERLRSFFEIRHECLLIGVCATLAGAMKACEESVADLIVLNMRFLENRERLFETVSPSGESPVVIALADTGDQACKAFELDAVDCILRPGNRICLERAFGRARERIRLVRERRMNREILLGLEKVSAPAKSAEYQEEIIVRTLGNRFFQKLKLSDVDWIESEGNYLRLHCGKESHLVRGTIANLADRIDPVGFPRIHRSVIVNFNSVVKWHPLPHGDYGVLMRDGTELTLSRRFLKNFRGI